MFNHQTLDITSFKERDIKLKEAIISAVKDTQSVVIRDLPDKILMTKAQFDMLQDNLEFMKLYDSKDFLYKTPLNVMEVQVKQ